MQLNIKKSVTLAAFAFAALTSQAQIKLFKVANGTRTAITSGTKVDILLNDDQTVKNNVVVELDIAAFKKAYKFDRVSITFIENNRTSSYVTHVFDSQLNLKKYQGKGIIPIYLFDTKNFKETDYRALLSASQPYEGPLNAPEIRVTGSYITGEEGYFDVNDNYKFRDVFSNEEPIADVKINIVYNPSQILEYDYQRAIRGLDNMESNFNRSVIENVEQYLAPAIATPLYGALANAMKEVFNARLEAVKKETDKAKAIAAVKQLSDDWDIMATVSKKDKSVLKVINKEIKTKTTVEEKWQLIKANA